MGFSVKKLRNLEVGENKQTVIKSDALHKAVMTLRAINNPLRKRIIDFINSNPGITVTKIYKKLKIEQSVASQHLAILRKAEFLIAKREGKFIHYKINENRFEEIGKLVDSI